MTAITTEDQASCDAAITAGDYPSLANRESGTMNPTLDTGLRELTLAETDSAAGGNPLMAGIAIFIGSYLATKTLDAQSEGDGWLQLAQKYGAQKRGGGSPK